MFCTATAPWTGWWTATVAVTRSVQRISVCARRWRRTRRTSRPTVVEALLSEDIDGTWQDYVYLNGRLVSVVRAGQVYSAHDDQTGRTLTLINASPAAIEADTHSVQRSRTRDSDGRFHPLAFHRLHSRSSWVDLWLTTLTRRSPGLEWPLAAQTQRIPKPFHHEITGSVHPVAAAFRCRAPRSRNQCVGKRALASAPKWPSRQHSAPSGCCRG